EGIANVKAVDAAKGCAPLKAGGGGPWHVKGVTNRRGVRPCGCKSKNLRGSVVGGDRAALTGIHAAREGEEKTIVKAVDAAKRRAPGKSSARGSWHRLDGAGRLHGSGLNTAGIHRRRD